MIRTGRDSMGKARPPHDGSTLEATGRDLSGREAWTRVPRRPDGGFLNCFENSMGSAIASVMVMVVVVVSRIRARGARAAYRTSLRREEGVSS